MDTSLVTLDVPDHLSTTSSGVIRGYEITSPSPERTEPITEQTDVKSMKLEPEVSTFQLYSEIFRRGGFSVSSSRSDESCWAYIARKLEALESTQENLPDIASHDEVKQNESERLEVFPNFESSNAPNEHTVETSANFFRNLQDCFPASAMIISAIVTRKAVSRLTIMKTIWSFHRRTSTIPSEGLGRLVTLTQWLLVVLVTNLAHPIWTVKWENLIRLIKCQIVMQDQHSLMLRLLQPTNSQNVLVTFRSFTHQTTNPNILTISGFEPTIFCLDG